MERVAGAPSLPVLTERDQRLAQLQQMLRDSELTPAEYRAAVAKIMSDPRPAAAFLEEAGWSPDAVEDIMSGVQRREGGLAGWAARTMNPAGLERSRRAAAEGARFDRSMEEFDRNLGLAMGQIDPEGQAPLAQPVAPEDEDQYWNLSERERGTKVGAPWGGGAPFKNDYARDQYYERPAIDPQNEALLREAGVPEADILRARMSQQDLDMMEPGIGSDQGWSMVYAPGHDGRAVPRQRAPMPSAMDAQGNPDPRALEAATADTITGGQRIGDRVANRDLRPDLRNESLEAQGYVPTPIEGPNGREWVYELSPQKKAENKLHTDALRANQSIDRLRDRAGVTGEMGAPAPGEADNLRSLIRQNRAAESRAQRDAFLKSRMNPRMRAETGLAEVGQPGMNDWQNLVLAQNLAPNLDPTTPLAADAFANQQMLQALQRQMTGRGFADNPAVVVARETAQMQQEQTAEERQRSLRSLASAAASHAVTFSDLPGLLSSNWERRAQVDAALGRAGALPSEKAQILSELFPPAAAAAPPDAGSPAAARRAEARRTGAPAPRGPVRGDVSW
jgi:hypothetical protein